MSQLLDISSAWVRIGEAVVLEDAALCVRPGEVVGVIGPNGAGKTTLLRAGLGLVRLDAGSARLGGDEARSLPDAVRAARVGYLPQERRVGWNLPAWRIAALGAGNRPPAAAKETALAALARVGLTPLAERGVLDMSGGERARALFARLLAAGAPLLAADEPIAGLDPDAQLLALELFREEAQRGAGVVLTLHDLTLAARSCDRLVVMDGGRTIAEGAPEAALTPDILRRVFSLDGGLEQTSAGVVVVGRRVA